MKLVFSLVETRLDKIEKTCRNHLRYLPDGDLLIFTYKRNFKEINNAISDLNYQLIEVKENSDPYSEHYYNILLTSVHYWEILSEYDRVLIFQHDSELFKKGIEDFYKFDYIGAPWRPHQVNEPYVGNGGLSLRSPKIMIEVLKSFKWKANYGEDMHFCKEMYKNKIGILATVEEASKFSVESVFSMGTIGAHAIEKYLTEDECRLIRTQYDNI